MILFLISSLIAVLLLGYYAIGRIAGRYAEKNIADLSDANYQLKRDIDLSRKRAIHLQHSMQQVKESMDLLQLEQGSLLDKQSDLLYYQKENLKNWTDDVKN